MIRRIQRSLLFPRRLLRPDDRALREPSLERWWVESDEGPVEAFFLPGRGGSPERPGPVVVHCHGNGELIDYWVEPLRRYREAGISVLLPEYRGYGRSAGRPSETAIASDLRAFHRRLVARPDVGPVLLHGRSLGGGAVCTLAASGVPVAGLVLESTFTSVPDVVPWAPRLLIADVFDNRRVLRDVRAPVLLMHGRRDQIVPHAHAERLRAVTPNAELVSFDCGHNDMGQGIEWWSNIERLLVRAGLRLDA